jgi:hypothetical protein
MNDKLDRVESALVGDPKFGSIGLVGRVTKLESKTVAIRWGIGGLVAIGSTVAGLIKLGIL